LSAESQQVVAQGCSTQHSCLQFPQGKSPNSHHKESYWLPTIMVYSDCLVLCLMATVLRCTCLFWEPSASLDISQRFLTFGIKQRYQKGSKHLSGLLRLEGAQQGRQSRAQGTSRTLQQCLTISESLCSRAGTVAKHQRCQTTHGISIQYTFSPLENCVDMSQVSTFLRVSPRFLRLKSNKARANSKPASPATVEPTVRVSVLS
jgi:hypothetical protein